MAAQPDSSASEPTFRRMRSEDIDAVFEVIQASFGEEWPKIPIRVAPLDHFKWKIGPPQALPDDASVVEIDGRIIGYSGSAQRDVWVRGQRLPGSRGGDVCVHPDFQSRRFTHARRAWSRAERINKPERFNISEGSTHPRLRPTSDRKDQHVPVANQVDMLTLHLNAAAVAWEGRHDPGGVSLRPVLRAARMYAKMLMARMRRRRFPTPAPPVAMRAVESFDEQADALWDRALHEFDFAVVRDSTYLNWRYCDPRAGDYHVRAAEDDGELAGWIVVASRLKAAEIVDLLTAPRDEGVLRALIEDAIAIARRDGATSLTLLMPREHQYRKTLLRYGFIPSRLPKPMRFGRRRSSVLDFLGWDAAARLHIAFGDSDHV